VLVVGPDDEVARWTRHRHGTTEDGLRALHVPLVVDGEVLPGLTAAEGVRAATARHAASRDELPRGARRLSADEAAVPTVELPLA